MSQGKTGKREIDPDLCPIHPMRASNQRSAMILTALAVLGMILPGLATERILTARDGRTMEARLVSKSDDSVGIIRVADSQWFVIALEGLSEEDREFIRDWTPKTEQVWSHEVFNREMIEPVEAFDTIDIKRSRRQFRSYILNPPGFFNHGGRWPAYRPHFQYRSRYCYRRPMISVTIR